MSCMFISIVSVVSPSFPGPGGTVCELAETKMICLCQLHIIRTRCTWQSCVN